MTDFLQARQNAVENYKWYKANEEELLKKYKDRYIAIKDKQVIGDYGDLFEGCDDMRARGIPQGEFIVHLCSPDENKNMVIIHNRVNPDWEGVAV